MVAAATVLFQPGWTHHVPGIELEDPVTGERFFGDPVVTEGRGVVQQPLWSGVSETGTVSVLDERIVMFAPVVDVRSDHEFVSPEGQVWFAISDGMPRGIPGKRPEYVAVRVRRAKERER